MPMEISPLDNAADKSRAISESILIRMLACCQETFMKLNSTFRNLFVERQGMENFLRNPLMNQLWIIPEPKPLCMANK